MKDLAPHASLITRHSSLLPLWLPVASAVALALAFPIDPTDFFVNLKLGEVALEQRFPPLHPIFAYAPADASAINAAWLAQVLFALVFRLGDLPALVVFRAVLTATAFAFVLAVCLRRSGRVLPAAAATMLALLIASPGLALRPQLFSVALFPLFLLLLSRPIGTRTLVALPALTALWANLHGGFVLGLLAIAASLAAALVEAAWDSSSLRMRFATAPALLYRLRGKRPLAETLPSSEDELPRSPLILSPSKDERAASHPTPQKPHASTPLRTRGLPIRLAALLLLSAAAACLNPFGPSVYAYAWRIGTNPIVRAHVTEWQPPSLADPAGVLFLASLVVLGLALALGRPRPWLVDFFLLAGFGLMTIQAQRNVLWWAMVTAPLLAVALARLGKTEPSARPLTRLVLIRRGGMAVASLALVVALLPWWRATNPILPSASRGLLTAETPALAVDHLAALPGSGRVFNAMTWGGYLTWALWPRYQVFADNLVEAYPPAVWRDYLAISAAEPGWQDLLDNYAVDYLVLQHTSQAALISAIVDTPGWRSVYDDPNAAVFARQAG